MSASTEDSQPSAQDVPGGVSASVEVAHPERELTRAERAHLGLEG